MALNNEQVEINRRSCRCDRKVAKTGKRPTILTNYIEEKNCRWTFNKDSTKYNIEERKRVMTDV